MVWAKWDQGQMPCALDGGCQGALVLRADTGLSSGLYLPAVGHVPAEAVGVLVVDVLYVVNAEAADLPTAVVSGPAPSAAESSARPSTGSASAGPSAWASRSRSGRSPWPGAGRSTGPRPGGSAWPWAGRWWSASLCRHLHSPCIYVVLTLAGFCWAGGGGFCKRCLLPTGVSRLNLFYAATRADRPRRRARRMVADRHRIRRGRRRPVLVGPGTGFR